MSPKPQLPNTPGATAGLRSAMPVATDGKILLALLCAVAVEATVLVVYALAVHP